LLAKIPQATPPHEVAMFRRCSFLAPFAWLALLLPLAASAADPCASGAARALVLGSGGSKGAFEAGAIYHLVVHRGCDFTEISGNSVGALNGAVLAQAARSADRTQSLANLKAAAENVVAEWDAIRSSRDMMRTRPLAKLRLAFVGLDSIEDFEPAREFIWTRVDLDRLAAGRELRIGAMSFTDGRYHEFLLSHEGVAEPAAREFIFASILVPVFSRMPVMAPPGGGAALQFGDGGVRHSTPVTSYFEHCTTSACIPLTGVTTPPHPRIEQLFVVVTSPYAQRNDLKPLREPTAVDPETGGIEDGRKILVRMFDLMVDTMHRTDLDDMLLYNDLLAWQARGANPAAAAPFPIGSFNRATPGAAAQPYEIALIAPHHEDADALRIFEADPKTQRERVFCGCIAADELMQTQFGQAPLTDRCVARFPAVPAKRRRAEAAALTPALCHDERALAAPPAATESERLAR
jgi:predicted acylesterase/phospholipase RssA